MKSNFSIYIKKTLVIVGWLVIWEIASQLITNKIFFVGPIETMAALFRLVPTVTFIRSIVFSFSKISFGYLLAFITALLLGILSYHVPVLKEILSPVVTLMKTIPVASFVVLLLLWAGSKNLSIFIAFIVVFPIIYLNTISGMDNVDPKLLEMATVFSIPFHRQFYSIFWPSLYPYLISSCKVALGMSWKSGVAAELIGQPVNSIGSQLYMAKIYISTSDLFAWTLVIIFLSVIFEKIFLLLLKRLYQHTIY
ncbi:MAG: ABC transporter permease [Lachnospiraceae bacterium]